MRKVTKIRVPKTGTRDDGLIRLNLGCGGRRLEGFIGVDITKTEATDRVCDLSKAPWPFKSDSVDEVKCWHFLEHLTGPQRCVFMNEAYRVMKPFAKMEIIVPHWSNIRSVQDPFHVFPPIAEDSFLYFNKGWRDQNFLSHYPITADFDFPYGYTMAPEVSVRNDEYQAFARRYYNNAVVDLHMTLWKRPPGLAATETAIKA